MIKVKFNGMKHGDANTYYMRCDVTNERGTTYYSLALDPSIHGDQHNATCLAERLNAMVADVARHAREDAVQETINSAGLRMALDANKRANNDVDDPFAAFRATSDDYNRRADIRAMMAALLIGRPETVGEDELACEALDAADAIARKLGIADAPANVTKCDVHTLEKLNAIRNAAIVARDALYKWDDSASHDDGVAYNKARRALFALIP